MEMMRLDGSPIAYWLDEVPGGEWCVWLHAAFADHRMYAAQLRHFAGRYSLLAIDILGHAGSADARAGDKMTDMADWIARIFGKHHIPAAHFVGVSLGAVLIQDFANRYADRVLSLACFGGYDINNFDIRRQQSNAAAQMKMMLKAVVSVRWFAESNKRISACTKEAQEAFYALNIQFRRRSFLYLAGLQEMVNRFPPAPRPYRLLVGCGEKDIPMEIAIVNEWAEEAHCPKAIIPEAGHCCNMDNPRAFNRCLEQFWEQPA